MLDFFLGIEMWFTRKKKKEKKKKEKKKKEKKEKKKEKKKKKKKAFKHSRWNFDLFLYMPSKFEIIWTKIGKVIR